jgi:hypothetical protein
VSDEAEIRAVARIIYEEVFVKNDLGLGPPSRYLPFDEAEGCGAHRMSVDAARVIVDRRREGTFPIWRNPAPDAAAPVPPPGAARTFTVGAGRERPPGAGEPDLPDDRG